MKNRIITASIMLIITIIMILASNKNITKYSGEIISGTDFCLNTFVTISIYDSKENYSDTIKSREDVKDLINDVFSLCKDYEYIFSKTLKESQLYRLNSSSKNNIEISKDLYDIINASIDYSKLSNGMFDVTISDLSDLWNFNNAKIPTKENIDKALKTLDYNNLHLSTENEKFYISIDNDSNIDLGGIAKGYIADRLKEYLISKGIKSGIINLGGNTIVINNKPDGSNFNIGIKKPFSKENQLICTVSINNKSVVTSGIYERYFEENGKIYHHIIDGKTGYPVENQIYSATIISDLSIDGDALSTVCVLAGTDEALKIINNLTDIECVIIDNEYNIHLSDGLTKDNDIIKIKSDGK